MSLRKTSAAYRPATKGHRFFSISHGRVRALRRRHSRGKAFGPAVA